MFRFQVDDEIELRLLLAQHAEALYAVMDRNRDHLRPWLPWVDTTNSPDDTRAFIKGGLEQLAANNGCQMGIWVQGELVGAVGFHYWNWNNGRTEIGYWLAEGTQGRGIMTRVCRALIDYAFGELGLRRVEIRAAASNARSRAVPERLGFTLEGAIRQIEHIGTQWDDMVVYGLLAHEWQGGASTTNA
jgi:ribosomal-protein-serine acetyltransferase